MNLLIFCDKGFEEECLKEIKHILHLKATSPYPQCCYIQNCSTNQAIFYVYKNQLALKVLAYIDSFKFEKQTMKIDLEKVISAYDWNIWIDKTHSFKVVAKILGEDMQEIGSFCGSLIKKKIPDATVNVTKPVVTVHIQYLHDQVFIGIDLVQSNLEKREYKIYTSPTTIRSTVAAGLWYKSTVLKTDIVLDPFCGSGSIMIESAFFCTNKSPRFYQKEDLTLFNLKPFFQTSINMLSEIDKNITEPTQKLIASDILAKCVDATKKNAKIAGVLPAISVSRIDVDWIDTKFEPNSINKIITVPPYYSEHTQAKLSKTYHQFFKRSLAVLSKNGTITLLTNNSNFVCQIAKEYFKKIQTQTISMGKSELFVIQCLR